MECWIGWVVHVLPSYLFSFQGIFTVLADCANLMVVHVLLWIKILANSKLQSGLVVGSTCTGERGGSVVECRTPEREVRGSKPTAAVLCPWARHFTPRKYWLITQEAMAPSRHDWKIVDWDVKPQHNQPTKYMYYPFARLSLPFWLIVPNWW